MLSKAKLDRGLRLLPVALLLATVALRVYEPAPVERLRLSVFDQYQALKPRESTELPVRVLDIDEKSLEKFGQWPWPRIRLAEIIDLLSESGAGAVLLDVLISEPDRLSPSRVAEMLPDEPWGNAFSYSISEHPIKPGGVSDLLTMRSDRSVISKDSPEQMFRNAKWEEIMVEIFLRVGPSSWRILETFQVPKTIGAPGLEKFLEAEPDLPQGKISGS